MVGPVCENGALKINCTVEDRVAMEGHRESFDDDGHVRELGPPLFYLWLEVGSQLHEVRHVHLIAVAKLGDLS